MQVCIRDQDQSNSSVDEPLGAKMESRITKLETTVDFIQRDVELLKQDVRAIRRDITGIRTTDFRLLFGAIIAVAVGLTGLMAKGFHWL